MSDEFAIRARGLSKKYRLGTADSNDSFREVLVKTARGLVRGRAQAPREFYALRDASFDVMRGENVGIIGANGAGKSTLLKILSLIVEPTAGSATVRGRLGALLEVGTGFHQELTGRENVFLYGAILGMGRKEVAAKFDAIVAFAEIERFIDTPVKRYSSGMYVRLAFAVAAHLQPDILLLDEVLAVGDLAFQRKCLAFAKELQQRDATILFVSHNMFSIKSMCSRVILLRSGEIVFDGPTDQGIAKYEEDARLSVVPWVKDNPEKWPIKLSDVQLVGADGAPKTLYDFGEPITVRMRYNAREPVRTPNVIVAFVRSDGVGCTSYTTESDGVVFECLQGDGVIEVRGPPLKLIADRYTVHILIRRQLESGAEELLCAQVGGVFHIRHHLYDTRFGVYHESAQWRLEQGGQADTGPLAADGARA